MDDLHLSPQGCCICLCGRDDMRCQWRLCVKEQVSVFRVPCRGQRGSQTLIVKLAFPGPGSLVVEPAHWRCKLTAYTHISGQHIFMCNNRTVIQLTFPSWKFYFLSVVRPGLKILTHLYLTSLLMYCSDRSRTIALTLHKSLGSIHWLDRCAIGDIYKFEDRYLMSFHFYKCLLLKRDTVALAEAPPWAFFGS